MISKRERGSYLDRLTERVLARVAAALLAHADSDPERADNVRDVEEAVLILVLLVYRAHKSGCGRQDLVDEDEDGLLGRQLNALADNVDELANGEVGGNQVLLLVDGRDIGLLDLLANNLLLSAGCSFVDGLQADVRECGRCTSGECARPRPCASRTGARP